ncbi:MAG: inositol monophosphatase family protein, partial [Longimicrobiales bacterium]
MSDDAALRDALDFAVELAWRAGRLTLGHFRAGVAIETKADRSPVTVADRDGERLIRAALERRFPDDGILGEEFGELRAGAERRWIIDPIDGTRSFARGVPLYGVMIALEAAGVAVLGVLHFPPLGETVYAARGLGCWVDGRRARVSAVATLAEALVLTTDQERLWRQDLADGWDDLRFEAGFVRTWGDCYGHALVATGRAEAMIDPVSAPWDAAALQPIIEEAGGMFSALDGRVTHLGGSAISTNAALAEAVRDRLR